MKRIIAFLLVTVLLMCLATSVGASEFEETKSITVNKGSYNLNICYEVNGAKTVSVFLDNEKFEITNCEGVLSYTWQGKTVTVSFPETINEVETIGNVDSTEKEEVVEELQPMVATSCPEYYSYGPSGTMYGYDSYGNTIKLTKGSGSKTGNRLDIEQRELSNTFYNAIVDMNYYEGRAESYVGVYYLWQIVYTVATLGPITTVSDAVFAAVMESLNLTAVEVIPYIKEWAAAEDVAKEAYLYF